MDRNPRKFVLTVTEVSASLQPLDNQFDEIELVFHGKVYPSSKKRLIDAVDNFKVTIREKQLL